MSGIPTAWMHVKMIFTTKPGQTSHNKPMAQPPISLIFLTEDNGETSIK